MTEPSRRAWMAAVAAGALSLPARGGAAPVSSLPTDLTGLSASAEAEPPRELRGAWVASVANIDWPTEPGLRDEELALSIDTTVRQAAAIGLNALFLQVRPSTDALYPSTLEPWSEYLVGSRPPPAWDPLARWIETAHAQGIELHAWFNPYRARHSAARQPPHPEALVRRRPEWVVRYGDQWWMDPAQEAARLHTLEVIADVVRRYDIDGVHVDDYFYPYPVKGSEGKDLPFPDDAAWQQYRSRGGRLARDDWRRLQVDTLVEQLHVQVRGLKPWVRLSISPFGIGRPDRRPPGITGFSQYDQLYADVERWCEAGWLDALVPQLYWPRSRPQQDFIKLMDSWIEANPRGRHLWNGLFTSSVANGTPTAWSAEEILWQVERSRTRSAVSGHVHFSLKALLQNRGGLTTALQHTTYSVPALPPPTPWSAPTERRMRGVRRWSLWQPQAPIEAHRWRHGPILAGAPVEDATAPPVLKEPSDPSTPRWWVPIDAWGQAGSPRPV